MNRACLPISMATVFLMMACHHEGGSHAPVPSNAIASKNLGAATTPADTRSAFSDGGIMSNDAGMVKASADARSATQDSGVNSTGQLQGASALATTEDAPRQAKQELAACDASKAVDVDRKALPVVRNWLETYRVVMRGEGKSEVAGNSSAKQALCEPYGSCDDPNGAFFWARFPWGTDPDSPSLNGLWEPSIIVRRTDGKFALIARLESTQSWGELCAGGDGYPVVLRFERDGLIHVWVSYTASNEYRVGCFPHRSQADIFVDPTTGDRVFSYFQAGSENLVDDESFPPIQSVSIVNNQAILTGPKCHVAIKLPAKNETK
ncbi:MAG: hypothetical protein FWD69_01600 [Polyangiaceae bacterium]|nr:hypothetical protein [Polyangiaceae bacterium]